MLKKALSVILLLASSAAYAQTTYIPFGSEDLPLLDRLETRSGRISNEFHSASKPVSRMEAVNFLREMRTHADSLKLTKLDQYNIQHMISVNGEWDSAGNGAIDSKHSLFKTFYLKQPDFVYVNKPDFFLSFNPVISAVGLYDKGTRATGKNLTSGRGVEIRGLIAKKIGFYTYVTDNQEQAPSYVDDWIVAKDSKGKLTRSYPALPGGDFYKKNGSLTYDYILARGYIDVPLIKNVTHATFGYDKTFIGDGVRSLIWSDFGASNAFLKLHTKIWKLNYTNYYMELTPQFLREGDVRQPHKYATMHHLSINATKWLNVGLFETVMFGRKDRYEFGYMNPIIFYRSVERGLGSPDNVILGLNFKAITLKHLQFYGQFILDEFTSKELIAGKGYWANKFGGQIGGKYFDALGIRNLDLQGEINMVRPYTYSHYDSLANFTHYNQPVAHPLGAGFVELIGIARYQPIRKLYLTVKGTYYKQGIDTGSKNYGSDIFKDYGTRTKINGNYGVKLINGYEVNCLTMSFNASYELRENLFIDLGASHRIYDYVDLNIVKNVTTYGYLGLRLNIARREYDFY